MTEEFNYEADPSRKIRITSDGKEIPDSSTVLTELGLVNNGQLEVTIEDVKSEKPKPEEKAASKPSNSSPVFAPRDKLPRPPSSSI